MNKRIYKKIILLFSGISLLSGIIFPVNAIAVNIDISDISVNEQMHEGTEILSPDEIPVNPNVDGIDEGIIKIMIDPGHYSNYNVSPVYPLYYESVMTWKLSNYLQQELQELGVHADLTKNSLDEDPSLNDRGFSSKGYDFFISVHSNAGASSEDHPLAIVYQDLDWTDIDDISKDIGGKLATKVAEVMGTAQAGRIYQRKGTDDWDRNGKLDDEWYSVLFASRFVGTPGTLLEHSFHTNYKATIWLYNDDNLKIMAKEEAELIYNYFAEKKTAEGIEVIPDIMYGDADGNNMIDACDASCILEYYSGISTGMEESDNIGKGADVNNDDIIDATDASIVLEYYSYLSTYSTESTLKKWLSEK